MQTQQKYKWGAAATNKCWVASLRAASEKKQGKSGKGRGIYYLGSALSTQKEHGSVKCVLSEHSLHYGWSVPGEVILGGRYPLAPSGEEEGGELLEAGRLSHWFYSPSSSQATYEIRYVIYPVAKVVNE